MAVTTKFHHLVLRLLVAAPALVLAHIEGAFATEPPAQDQAFLQPIIVTATRQRTTIQTTPISIQGVTGAQLASRGIANVNSLVATVPGLSIRSAGGPGQEEFEIRGLNSQGGSSSMVGLYLGEIPLSSAMSSELGKGYLDTGLYDVERVEVLRGPQGTLYGSSSMGGTIRVLPNEPRLDSYAASTEAVLSGTASGGGFNHRESAMVNLPLGDTAAVRIVGSFANQSGWIQRRVIADGAVSVDPGVYPTVSRPDNFYTAPLQENLGGVNTTQVDSTRAELLWKPLENLTIEPTAMYQRVQQGAPPAVDVDGNPTRPTTPAVLAHWEIYDAPEPQTDSLAFGSLKAVYQFSAFSVTSSTGFWHRNSLYFQDTTEQTAAAIGIPVYDAAAGGVGPGYTTKGPGTLQQDSTRQLSEELRLTSTAPGPLQWVAGYFYQDLHSDSTISGLAPQATPILGGINLYNSDVPEVMVQNAIYGNISWQLSPHFTAAAGFRHYHYSLGVVSSEQGLFSAAFPIGDNAVLSSPASLTAGGTVPSVVLTYNIDPDHMVYARADKGFRLGGVTGVSGPIPVVAASNTNPLLAVEVANECGLQQKVLLTTTCNPNILLQVPATYGSDSVWSYEVGEKSSFLSHRLIANVDAYLEHWNNPQIATAIAGYGAVVNGGDAHIKGVEVQFEALLPFGFDTSLNAGYVDAKFVRDSAIAGYSAGTRIPDTPKVSASAVLAWKHYMSDNFSMFGSLEENYTGAKTNLPYGSNPTLQNIDQLLVHLPAYSMVNFRFGLAGERNDGDRWSAALFVDNLTNRQVLLDPQPQISLTTTAFARYVITRPLTAGVNVSYSFH